MAKYLDLAGLKAYDGKIKEWIKSGIADITDDAILALFKTEDGYTLITLKKVDISGITYEEVDLGYGLPIWANKNIGAASTEDYGTYFSWGNTEGYTAETKFVTVEEACQLISGVTGETITTKEELEYILSDWGLAVDNFGISEYSFDSDSYRTTPGASLTSDITSENDAATVNMGEAWRMPTRSEYRALLNAIKSDKNADGLTCKYIYLDKEGNRQEFPVYRGDNTWGYFGVSGLTSDLFSKILGIEFSNDSTGASLYFPACSFFTEPVTQGIGYNGFYWSSSISDDGNAHCFNFNHKHLDTAELYLCRYGMCVRAVK